jgi:hypothetical protein
LIPLPRSLTRLWMIGPLALLAVCGFVVYSKTGSRTGPPTQELVTHSGVEHPSWATWLLIASIVLAVLALLGVVVRSERMGDPNTREKRVARLTTALTEAVAAIESIKSEVTDGQALLTKLETEIRDNTELADLTAEQAGAVREMMRAETGRGSRVTVLVGIAGLVMGSAVTWYLSR